MWVPNIVACPPSGVSTPLHRVVASALLGAFYHYPICTLIDAIIFVSIDILALLVQAAGGGIASKEVQKINGHADRGGHIMLGELCQPCISSYGA